MSRLGRKPIKIPAGVEVKITGDRVQVKGKLGTLVETLPEGIHGDLLGDTFRLKAENDEKQMKARHGLAWASVRNAIIGVHQGFTKVLELSGPGYKVSAAGSKLTLAIGYSSPVEFTVDKSLQVSVKGNQVTVTGSDKAKLGEVAAEIRNLREVEPYKERGIKYANEKVRRKVSKAAKV